MRSLTVGLLLLPCSLPAQEVLVGTYSYGVLSTELSGSCGLTQPIAFQNEFGTLTFQADGSFTLNAEQTFLCGGASTSVQSDAGVYTLSIDGALELDFNPGMPGVDVVDLFLSPDRQVLVEDVRAFRPPSFVFALRQTSGMATSDLVGDFAAASYCQGLTSGGSGPYAAGAFGDVTFDGLGSAVVTGTELTIVTAGTSTASQSQTATYSVLPNGQLLIDGSTIPTGQISSDGEIGFVMSEPGDDGDIVIFVKEKGAPPTADALEDAWFLASYGAVNDLAGGGIQHECSTGFCDFEPATGNFTLNLTTNTLSSPFGVGTGTGSSSGTFALGADGSLATMETGEPFSDPGWLARGETLAISATIDTNSGGPAIAVFVRAWDLLEADVDTISVAAGGAQNFTLRAGDALAGRPYMVLGTALGSYPGLLLGGAVVPLNYSAHLLFSLSNLNVAPFVNTFALLDADGKATASIVIPPGTYGSVAGASIRSAAIVFEPPGFTNVVGVSRAVPLAFVP